MTNMRRLLALWIALLWIMIVPGIAEEVPVGAAESAVGALRTSADALAGADVPAAVEPPADAPGETSADSGAEPSAGPVESPAAEPSAAPSAEATPSPSAEPSVEPSVEPSANPSSEPSAEPSPSATPSADPSANPSVEPSDTVRPSPESSDEEEPASTGVSPSERMEFDRGYARIRSEATGYAAAFPGADTLCRVQRGVVYVLERRAASDCDRLLCAFDGGEGEVRVWIDAADLYLLDTQEAQDFVKERMAVPGTLCLSGDDGIPLDALNHSAAVTYELRAETEPTPEIPAMIVGQAELVLEAGESAQLDVAFSDGEEHRLMFTSHNTRIAQVSQAGKISAKKSGSTTVYVRSEFGSEASVCVRVE